MEGLSPLISLSAAGLGFLALIHELDDVLRAGLRTHMEWDNLNMIRLLLQEHHTLSDPLSRMVLCAEESLDISTRMLFTRTERSPQRTF